MSNVRQRRPLHTLQDEIEDEDEKRSTDSGL